MLSILVTLDGSGESEAVLPAIQKLAGGQAARVQLLNVQERPSATVRHSTIARAPSSAPGGVPGAPGVAFSPSMMRPPEPQWAESEEQAIERVIAEGREYLEGLAESLADAGLEVECDVVVSGDAANAIIDYARETHMDLIAMATHGRSGLSSLVQGSVSSAVVRSGVAPVLLVRPSQN